MLKKMKKVAIWCIIASLLIVNVAFSADVVVTGGSLEIDDLLIADFNPITLDGTTQDTSAVVTAMALTDSRGTGDGWNVSLKASQFEHGTILGEKLPLDSLALGTVSIVEKEGVTGSTAIAGIAILGGTIDNVAGVVILNAPGDEGMGTYTVNMEDMTLTLKPATTYAGTYTSTVTMTFTSGPSA
jgi:hypothetical protein